MTIDTNEPAPDQAAADASHDDRKSVTVTLPSRRGVVRGAIAVVILALVATVVVESIHIHHLSRAKSDASLALLRLQAGAGGSFDATQHSALTAATSYATAFSSYNYRHLTQDFAATESHATGPFLTQYRKSTAAIQPNLVKLKSISTGKVVSAGIASVTPTSAVVDLFVNQTIVNSARPKPTVEPQRMQMELTRDSATSPWLISKVTLP
jgi:hypothetical protein